MALLELYTEVREKLPDIICRNIVSVQYQSVLFETYGNFVGAQTSCMDVKGSCVEGNL